MIRNIIIVVLTLGAVATLVLGVVSALLPVRWFHPSGRFEV